MRTRLFLRTSEFLWQEGHTAHATKEEAIEEAKLILGIYAEFAENVLAMPVLTGLKSENERFAGALDTYCIEALMQDGKALQAGTSHFLGQNFAKAFDVKFLSKEGKQEYVWATSWGVSTRLIGGLIMTHSDDLGLVLPPSIAPKKVVIIPIFKNEEERSLVNEFTEKLIKSFKINNISYIYDDDESKKPGWKFAEYELKGVPLRITVGPKDVASNSMEIARRDTMEKFILPANDPVKVIQDLLEDIQINIFKNALERRERNTHFVDSYDKFKNILEEKGGFIWAYWDGKSETEMKIKEETKATIRLIPLKQEHEMGKCVYTGQPTKLRVLFAKAY
jgi:prolyl-tRNA synthetase